MEWIENRRGEPRVISLPESSDILRERPRPGVAVARLPLVPDGWPWPGDRFGLDPLLRTNRIRQPDLVHHAGTVDDAPDRPRDGQPGVGPFDRSTPGRYAQRLRAAERRANAPAVARLPGRHRPR